MKKFLILALALLVYSYTYADENEAEKNAGKITGKVVEQKNSTAVSFATIALIRASDSTIVAGVISDETGQFQLENIPFDKYQLRITFVGYKPIVINNINLSRKNRKLVIPVQNTSFEETITEMDEVVVAQERLKGEEKIDRTVFTVNEDVRKSSSSGLDLLNHIPSLSVDFQDNVTMEGQSNIQFYVDGVLRNKDYVAQLDPSTIDKVEVISNPGVKYSADISGVINIVLKKTRRYGVSGSVLVPIVHPEKVLANPRLNLEYGNQNFRVYAGDRLHHERFHGSEYLTTELDKSTSNPYYYEKVTEGDMQFQNNYLNYGFDWFISDKTTLNFLGECRNYSTLRKNMHSTNALYEDEVLTEYYETDRYNKSNRNNYYFSLFLKQKINEESELTAEGYMYLHASEEINRYQDTYFETLEANTVDQELSRSDYTDNFSNTAEFRLDYNFVLGGIKHETGIREFKSWMSNDFTNAYSLESLTNEIVDNFTYDEHRQTAYYNLIGKLNKFNWQLGVRGEYSSLNIQDTTKTDFFVFLPQFNISYQMEKQQSLKFSFRRQIQRPSAYNLNPFVTWMDSLHIRVGNPDLKPSYENRMELTYAKNIGSNYISPKLYLRYTEDGIQDLTEINSKGVTVIQQANIGKSLEYGLSLSAAAQFFKRWRVNTFMSVYETRISSGQGMALEEDNQRISYQINGNSIVMLPKEFGLMAMVQYNSPRIIYQREMRRDLLVLVGAQKTIKEKVKIEAYFNPFIDKFMYARVTTQAPGYYEDWKGILDVKNLFAIEITYNFNYGKKIKKLNRSAEYERDNAGGAL